MSWGIFQFTLLLMLVAFIGLCVWAHVQMPFFTSVPMFLENPWGIVTLIDLYLGFFLFAGFVLLFEDNKIIGWIWAVLPLFLGNAIGLAYIIFNGRKLSKALWVRSKSR